MAFRLYFGNPSAGAGGPSISGVDDATPEEGSALVITGTAFQAAQGAGGVTIGGVAQTETAWADTSITSTVVLGALKFGTAYNVVVTDNDSVASPNFALTSLQPAVGNGFVNVGTPNADTSIRLTSIADAVSGDQVEWENSALITINSDLTWNADASVTTIRARIWTAGDGYGPWTEQTINQTAGGAGTTGRRRMQLKLGF